MIDIIQIIILFLLVHYSFFIYSILRGLNNISVNENYIEKFVTVIIPFRNEENNLLNCLRSIELQNYNQDMYEVIFVNDNSNDDSLNLLNKNISTKNIKILNLNDIESEAGHKKAAITLGVDNSKGEIILVTDADCIVNKNWLRTMVSEFEKNTSFVAGPVELNDRNSLFGRLQKLEFAGLVLTGAGLVGNKTPIICSGANIAFKKKTFYEVGGYSDKYNYSSGDDVLLLQKIAAKNENEIKYCLKKDALVKTDSSKSLKEFINQRKRWASIGFYYSKKSLVLKVILIFAFIISLIVQPLLGIFYNDIFLWSFLVSITIKIFMEYLVIKEGIKLIFDESIIKVFYLAEFLHIPYLVLSVFMGMFGKLLWKEREINR